MSLWVTIERAYQDHTAWTNRFQSARRAPGSRPGHAAAGEVGTRAKQRERRFSIRHTECVGYVVVLQR